MIVLFAFCCGAIVANLYYAQPVVALMAPDLGMTATSASLIVSLTQIGYALGLFFLVPLGDVVDSKKLMLATAALSLLSLLGSAFVHSAPVFLALALLVGLSSVAVQLLIPLAANLVHDDSRGRVVGTIMSGLLLGVLLSRPLSSFITGLLGWRAVYEFATVVMLLVIGVLAVAAPTHKPTHESSYFGLIRSLGHLFAIFPVLRHRSLYQALLFGAFSLFWTVVPMELMGHHHASASGVALFCLIGAVGATSAPLAGRLADSGHGRQGTMAALAIAALAFAPTIERGSPNLIGLVVAGIVLDFAVQMNMVLGQREIYALDPSSRNRLNAIYMTSIFLGGAIGSSIAGALYERGGWILVALVATGFPLLAFSHFALSARARSPGH